MFNKNVYIERRKKLTERVSSGVILFLGNTDVPMNYTDNPYRFRQDSNFLYYFGLDEPGLAGVIDVDSNDEILFGNNRDVDDVIWMGPDLTITEKANAVGVPSAMPYNELSSYLSQAVESGRKVHFLPPYRAETKIELERLLGIRADKVVKFVSQSLSKAVVAQRSIKHEEEIEEIEKALEISYEMYSVAMKKIQPGLLERQLYGELEGITLAMGNGISFPVILSIHGETLHNHHHENVMGEGDIVVLDSGAESEMHYASDITRTIPVSGKFTEKQKEIYNIVLKAQTESIEMMKPGVQYREIHLHAAKVIAEGFKDIGLMKGDIEDAVLSGAHALFFPHGLGHMMGLDVHDMEGLGENLVGYNSEVERSKQFGLAYLRFAKTLKPGHVITVEPGIYFIPQLIEKWKNENMLTDFINYDKVEEYREFGGIRIEDDVLVTPEGHRVLGKRPIPKTIEDVEEACSGK